MQARSKACLKPQLPVVLKILPEVGPSLAQSAADVDVWMVARFFVLYTIGIRSMPGELAGREVAFKEAAGQANDNQRLRGRTSIPALPKRVNAADGLWQSIAGTIQIDGASFAVVARQDAEVDAILLWQRISDFGNAVDQFRPA